VVKVDAHRALRTTQMRQLRLVLTDVVDRVLVRALAAVVDGGDCHLHNALARPRTLVVQHYHLAISEVGVALLLSLLPSVAVVVHNAAVVDLG
ncbi:hypothetical protein PFISCL1PPCAC_3228, partial [Pristionchus fissidentatus]